VGSTAARDPHLTIAGSLVAFFTKESPMHRNGEPRAFACRPNPEAAVLGLAILLLLPWIGACGQKKPAGEGNPRAVSPPASGTDGSWSAISSPERPFNLLLITLDTTRRDHLSCYGAPAGTTPNLDRLAAEGILFEDPVTPVPVTLAAHSTIMTGLYPYQHGVRNNGSFVLPDSFLTLAEMLKSKGYDTGAVIGAFPVTARFGLSQGFDFYDDRFPSVSKEREEETARRPGTEVARLALEWLAKRGDRPFFLWAHFYDPHAPYRPPEPFKSRFQGDPYTGAVASMDAAVGTLLDGLREKGLLENTVVMAMGDHGEGLGDHVELTHTVFIYRSTMDVPFLIRFPDKGPFTGPQWRGRKVPGLVDLVDALPTAWNTLGFPRDALPGGPGLSLLPVIQGQGEAHTEVYLESMIPKLEKWAADLRGLETPEWKYIRVPRPELYNLKDDPRERVNLAEKEKDRMARMEARLAVLLRGEKTSEEAPVDKETAEKLRSLGYLAGSSLGSDTGPTADAKDMIWVPMSVSRAQDLAAQHRFPEALATVDSVLAKLPRTRLAQQLRALYLSRVGRSAEALKAYDEALAECRDCPDRLKLLQSQAAAMLEAGRTAEALKQARDLVQVYPHEPWLHMLLGDALQAGGDIAGARAAFEEETHILPHDSVPLCRLANLEQAQKNYPAAEKAARAALQLRPDDTDAMVILSGLLTETHHDAEADQWLVKALAADPEHPGANYRKAENLYRAGRKEEAVRYYQTALQSVPFDPTILHHLGNTYIELGQVGEATRCLEKAVATGRAYQGVYASLGIAYARAGNTGKAVEEWEQAVRKDPTSPMVRFLRQNIEAARSGRLQMNGGGGKGGQDAGAGKANG
jgi:choline-sulfatase